MISRDDIDFFPLAASIVQRAYGRRAALGAIDYQVLAQVLDDDAAGWKHVHPGTEGLRAALIAASVLREAGVGPAWILISANDQESDAAVCREARLHGLKPGRHLHVYPILDDAGRLPAEAADSLRESPLLPGLFVVLVPAAGNGDDECGKRTEELLRDVAPEAPVVWLSSPVVDTEMTQALSAFEYAGMPHIEGLDLFGDPDRPAGNAEDVDRPRPPLREVAPEPGLPGRTARAREAAAHLLTPRPGVVVVAGRRGCGRSAFLGDVAGVLGACSRARLRQLHLSDETPSETLREDLELVAPPDVAVIDDFDRHLRYRGSNDGITSSLMHIVRTATADRGTRFLLVVEQRSVDELREISRSFIEGTTVLELDELPVRSLVPEVERAFRAAAPGVAFDDDVIETALRPAEEPDGPAHPGLALDRLDLAVARATVQGADRIEVAHLGFGHVHTPPKGAAELKHRLRQAVRGQDRAVDLVAERLAPALVGLKQRPQRPHGVFLFAGPTGVGKTETAHQVAQAVYGSADAVIRLDMSEYADAQDARMKLIGASRIWKNSTTEGLLTTKVRQNPRSVVLLDEFEKSHPEVWPLFLQVFDEGWLTDGWGQQAAFGETIIIATTNLGVCEGAARRPGFGARDGFDVSRQEAAIARSLPPELLNRFSAIVGFESLGPRAIAELADMELARTRERMAVQGWVIDYDDDVVAWIAETGYDAACGARHLQRNIENRLFPLLASAPDRTVRVVVESGLLRVASAVASQ